MNYINLYYKYKLKYINLKNKQYGSGLNKYNIHLIWFGNFPLNNYTKLKQLRLTNKNKNIILWIYPEIRDINKYIDHNFIKKYNITVKIILINNKFFQNNVKVWLDLHDWGDLRYAAASDSWRIYILYKYGGIYTDFSNILNTIPIEWFNTENPWLLGDGNYGTYPSLLGSNKHNKIFKKVLQFMHTIDYSKLNTINKSKHCRWKNICNHINFIIGSTDLYKLNKFVIFNKNTYQIYFNINNKKIKTKWFLGSNLSTKIGNLDSCNQEFIFMPIKSNSIIRKK